MMKKSVRAAVLGGLVAVTGACSILDGSSSSDQSLASVPTGNPNGKDDGLECGTGQDCKSGVCLKNMCQVPTSTDKVKNGAETGLDCGGPFAPKCGGGQGCNLASDCGSNNCDNGRCAGPAEIPPAPDNRKKDGDETDVDCGGAVAPKCMDTKACAVATDCLSGICTDLLCAVSTGTDGIKNGDESDTDCGGSTTGAARCGTDLACNVAEDCDSKNCDPGSKKCLAPTGTDGIKNGDESDTDCGGTTTGAARCAVGASCNVHGDCATDGCNEAKQCADRRSCTQANGGTSCGAAGGESCCTELAIPGRATKLDKYKVTAGRMRSFIQRTNGNVLGWYEANKGSLSQAARNQIEPYKGFLSTDMQGGTYSADYNLGGTIYLTDRPSNVQGCYVGNAGNQANGSHTWFNGGIEGEDRAFDQAYYDRLPLNCVTYPMIAAFCAWDGGRLQTFEENSTAYGAGTYPWGNAPAAGTDLYGAITGPATLGFTAPANACPGCDATRMNFQNNWQQPVGGNPNKPWDYAFYISPPGRFPLDVGPGGHRDIGGLMMELTATPGANDAKYGATVKWSRAASWEGHPANYGAYAFAILTKYGKTGGRCARD